MSKDRDPIFFLPKVAEVPNYNLSGYKKIGPADFLVTDAENAAIAGMAGIADQLALEGFFSQGFSNEDGTWRVIVSPTMLSKKTDADGAKRLAELLGEAGFKDETPTKGSEAVQVITA